MKIQSKLNTKLRNLNYRDYEPKDDDIINLMIPKEIQKNLIFTEFLKIIFDLIHLDERTFGNSK